MSTAIHRTRRPVAWISLALAGGLLIARASRHDWITGDTRALVTGLPAISHCLRVARLIDCNQSPGVPGGGIEKFPLIQTLPGYLLRVSGMSTSRVISVLIMINTLAVGLFVVAVARWSHRRGGVALAILATLALVAGMLIAYGAQSFGEALAAVAFGSVVLTGMRDDRVSPYLAPAAIAATITKETAAPIVACFAAASVLISAAALPVQRRALLHAGIGVVIGQLANFAFNEFRYGTLINHAYLDEDYAPLHAIPANAIGQLVAPDGGVIWFWPAAGVAAAVLMITLTRRSTPSRQRAGAALGLIGATAALVSNAAWWDPYGWYSWGPRLLLPAATATVTLAIGTIVRHDLRRSWLSVTGVLLIGTVAFLVLIPTIGSIYSGGASQIDNFRATWVSRPACNTQVRLAAQLQQSCTTTEAWRLSSMPLPDGVLGSSFAHHHAPDVVGAYWLTVAAAGTSIVAWLAVARRRVQAPDAARTTSADCVPSPFG